jgi:hypothetical protein
VRACILVWLLGCGAGVAKLLLSVPQRIRLAEKSELLQRQSTWSPIYGFAEACVPRLTNDQRILLVDPTGMSPEPEGASTYGLRGDIDVANLSAFSYRSYPHRVTALGHFPEDWTSTAASTDYLAIWEQTAYREEALRTSSREVVEETIRQLPFREVCSYENQQGDRGLVFAVSSGALQAAAASARPARDEVSPTTETRSPWRARGATLVGMLALWCIGRWSIRLLAGTRLPAYAGAALALPMGCLAVAIELMVESLLGARWSLVALVVPWVPLAAAALYADRKEAGAWFRSRSSDAVATSSGIIPLAIDEKVAIVALVAVASCLIVIAPLGLPFSDGFQFYYFKARAFFTDQSLLPFHARAEELRYVIPAHPPLIPLSLCWLYSFIGGIDEHATQLLWAGFLLSGLAIFYVFARGAVSRRVALFGTLALAVLGTDFAESALAGGFTDMPFAIYALMGCTLVAFGTSQSLSRIVAASGVCFAAATLTKEEGVTVFGIAGVLTLALAISTMTWKSRAKDKLEKLVPGGMGLFAFVLATSPWWVIRFGNPIPQMLVHFGGEGAGLFRKLSVAAAGFSIRLLVRWSPVFLLLLAGAVGGWRLPDLRKLASDRRRAFPLWIVFGQAVVDIAAIAMSRVETSAQVRIASSRLLLQLSPLLYLVAVELWPRLLEMRTTEGAREIADDRALELGGSLEVHDGGYRGDAVGVDQEQHVVARGSGVGVDGSGDAE